MAKVTLVVTERGTTRRWSRDVELPEVPGVGETYVLTKKLPFGKQKVSGHALGPNEQTQVMFEDLEPHVFDKFGEVFEFEHVLGWQLTT